MGEGHFGNHQALRFNRPNESIKPHPIVGPAKSGAGQTPRLKQGAHSSQPRLGGEWGYQTPSTPWIPTQPPPASSSGRSLGECP